MVSARRHADRRVLADRHAAKGPVAARPGPCRRIAAGIRGRWPAPPPPKRQAEAIAAELRDRHPRRGAAAGFDAGGFAPATLAPEARPRVCACSRLRQRGFMATWAGSAERTAARADPRPVAERKTVVSLAMNYGPRRRSARGLDERDARGDLGYAQGRDYHDVVKSRLKRSAASSGTPIAATSRCSSTPRR
jgi:hypothetical protein